MLKLIFEIVKYKQPVVAITVYWKAEHSTTCRPMYASHFKINSTRKSSSESENANVIFLIFVPEIYLPFTKLLQDVFV